MIRLVAALAVLAAGLVLTPVATGQDVDAIKKATLEHLATNNAGDAAGHVRHHLAGHSAFAPGGGLLEDFPSLERETEDRQANFDAGLKLNVEIRHLKVSVYGDVAVVTGYVMGTVTRPDGRTEQVNNRRTAVLIKQGGQWKEVHVHASPLTAPQQ